MPAIHVVLILRFSVLDARRAHRQLVAHALHDPEQPRTLPECRPGVGSGRSTLAKREPHNRLVLLVLSAVEHESPNILLDGLAAELIFRVVVVVEGREGCADLAGEGGEDAA